MAAERLTDEELDYLESVFSDEDVLRLVAEVRASRELLAELEWKGVCWYGPGESEAGCPSCEVPAADLRQPDGKGLHEPGCKLALAIGAKVKG